MWWKQRYRLPKTDEGQVTFAGVGLMLIVYFSIFMLAQTMWQRMSASSAYLEDALACSNLAGAVVDLREYGFSGEVILEEPERVYQLFLTALKANLNLGDDMVCRSHNLLQGRVEVERFIMYNVTGTTVCAYDWQNGVMTEKKYLQSMVYAPNGEPVDRTGIYSEISYDLSGIFGETYRAHKGKLVDVTAERS